MSRYFIFATVVLSLLLYSTSGTTVSVAFPVITSSFDASLILAGWVLSIYQLVATATMPLAGKAGDIFGGRRVFMVSLSFFMIGSLLCAIAPNIYFLILSRLVQAIGGGSFIPLAAGIVAGEFPRQRQRAIGLLSSVFPIGQIIGPNLGGWLVQSYGWRSIFWLNIPFGVIVLVASAFLLKSGQREESQIDLAGAGLFTGSIFAFTIGLSQMGNSNRGSSWLLTILFFIASAILMTTFVRHEKRVKNPITDLRVLKERPFIAANIYNLILGASIFSVMSFIPLYAVTIYGKSVLESGLILTPMSVGSMVASTVTSILLTRWGYRWPILAGTGAIVVSVFLLGMEPAGMSILGIQLSSTVLLVAIIFVAGIGLGMATPAANNACIELMPDRVATITGVRGMFRQSGGAIGIAVTSLSLYNIGNMAHGFAVVFSGLAVVMLLAVPFVFLMPAAPRAPSLGEGAGKDVKAC